MAKHASANRDWGVITNQAAFPSAGFWMHINCTEIVRFAACFRNVLQTCIRIAVRKWQGEHDACFQNVWQSMRFHAGCRAFRNVQMWANGIASATCVAAHFLNAQQSMRFLVGWRAFRNMKMQMNGNASVMRITMKHPARHAFSCGLPGSCTCVIIHSHLHPYFQLHSNLQENACFAVRFINVQQCASHLCYSSFVSAHIWIHGRQQKYMRFAICFKNAQQGALHLCYHSFTSAQVCHALLCVF